MRILIVEDERELREIIRQSLTEAGYLIELATDGMEGLYKALELDVDAVARQVGLAIQDSEDPAIAAFRPLQLRDGGRNSRPRCESPFLHQ